MWGQRVRGKGCGAVEGGGTKGVGGVGGGYLAKGDELHLLPGGRFGEIESLGLEGRGGS